MLGNIASGLVGHLEGGGHRCHTDGCLVLTPAHSHIVSLSSHFTLAAQALITLIWFMYSAQ
jgi:hypothetical protein